MPLTETVTVVFTDRVSSTELARGRGHAFTALGELTLKGLPEQRRRA